MGAAWLARTDALAAAIAVLITLKLQPSVQYRLALASGAVALSTLLWSGRAAATERALRTAHRISDIAHMIAAAIWLGGIAAFGLQLSQSTPSDGHTRLLARSLAGFSCVETVEVAIICLIGLLNGYPILGADIMKLVQSPYDILLAAKLILFAAMLAMAANDRWKLTPALSDTDDGVHAAWSRMRTSIAFEFSAGPLILTLVAWFGTLTPI